MVLNSIVEQIRIASLKKNRLALFCGSILGSFIPFATYFVAHLDTRVSPLYWVLVAGGLMFSAKTVYDWTRIAFQSGPKAFGFVVLVEGVMTFSTIAVLSYFALAVLAIINGVATGCNIALNQREYNRDVRQNKPVALNLRPNKAIAPVLERVH